jgi:tetratricopeptide (TPR) repeat protein
MRTSRLQAVFCGALALTANVAISQTATPADGTALLMAGKLSDACKAFEEVLSRDAANEEARNGEVAASEKLALEARAHGQMDDALRSLLQAKEYVPDSPKLLYDLGILEDEMKLYIDADKTLAQLEKLTPSEPMALYAVARVKLDLGQLAVAEDKMQQYLKLKPDDASAHYGLGRIYRQGLQFEQAQAEFQRCIELQPTQTEGYYQLGDTQLQTEDYADAIANFAKTLERNPQHGGALAGTGIAYFKRKQYDKALASLQKATAAAPDYQPAHYYLGLTLARLGRQTESAEELKLASDLANQENKQGAGHLRLNEQAP